MSRVLYVVIICAALFPAAIGRQNRVRYGPVVTAYLTGLAEELNELEYQLAHREIAPSDYSRARQRLLLLHRFIEHHAAHSSQDIVPELQILVSSEFGALGLGRALKSDELIVGAELDSLWKLVSVEHGAVRGKRSGERFFVFERLPQKEASTNDAGRDERRRDKARNELALIETITVREIPPPPKETAALPNKGDDQASRPSQASASLPGASANSTPPRPKLQPPRILHIYLPEYTDKARLKQIEGDLILRALFQHDGKIKNIKVEKELGLGLDERAVEAIKRTGFLPAQFDGRDVDAKVEIIFDFKLAKVSARVRVLESSAGAGGVER